MKHYLVAAVLLFGGSCATSTLRVTHSAAIGKVVSAECVNGSIWEKTIIKTDRVVVPVRWCQPVLLGEEAWMTTYKDDRPFAASQCWVYTAGTSYNCQP